jgi:hypothetical protein
LFASMIAAIFDAPQQMRVGDKFAGDMVEIAN